MTYTSVDELPSEVLRAFDYEDAVLWMESYNKKYEAVLNEFGPDADPAGQAKEAAWDASKNLPSSRYVMCNVSTEVVDKDGDLADVDAYVAAGQQFVRFGGQVARNHSNHTIGVVWKVFKGVDSKTEKPCVIACVNFFRGAPTYERAWKDFLSRRLGWSIGSMTMSKRECSTMSCYNRLVPTQWHELSLVDYPRNPITYNIEMNETAKGADVLEMHEDECPILRKYREFKEHMKGHGIDAHIVEGGTMLLVGEMTDEIKGEIAEEYPEYRVFTEKGEDGQEYALVVPHYVDTPDEFLRDMVALVEDEREAIAGYHTVTNALIEGNYLDDETLEKTLKAFEEVISDEEEHIGVILEVIKIVDPELFSSIADGMKEAEEEADKGCPAGQHEHAGVVGCHDIFRKHSIDYQTNPMQTLDLTDENIDVNAIKDTPTDKLREIVVRIAKILARYDDEAVKDFMSSTAGKEFVLAYMELKRRQMQGEDTMSESNVKDAEPAVNADTETDKGLLADPQTSMANIASTLAALTNTLDGMNTRIMRLEATLAAKEEEHTDITDAILSDDALGAPEEKIEEKSEDESIPAPAKTESEEEADSAVPPVDGAGEEKKEETEETVTEKVGDSDGKNKEEEETESESKTESEDSDDKAPAKDEKSKDKKEEKTEEKKEDKEEKKDEETKKGDSEEETETEEKSEEEVVETKEEPEEKGEEAPVEAPKEEEDKGCHGTPEVKAEAPVQEEVKSDLPAEVEAGESEATAVVEDMQLPVPPGGNTVDFRSAILKRQEELKAKGVTFTYGSGQASASLAGVPGGIQATNGYLVQPSNKATAFSGDVSPADHSIKGLWKDMGKYDPKTFFNKLTGE